VTSFRPRSPYMKDDTVLTTVRPISDLSELYYEFAEYRCEIMEERLRKVRKDMIARRRARKKFDTIGHKRFLEESAAFMQRSNREMVEDSKVMAGYIDKLDIPDVVVGAAEDGRLAKRARVE